jgi:hypothetical protein
MHNQRRYLNKYFWRLYNGTEIDYLEEEDGRITGYECKWSAEKWRKPKVFLDNYPESQLFLVNRNNFFDYL